MGGVDCQHYIPRTDQCVLETQLNSQSRFGLIDHQGKFHTESLAGLIERTQDAIGQVPGCEQCSQRPTLDIAIENSKTILDQKRG